jgi:hypothetical protein
MSGRGPVDRVCAVSGIVESPLSWLWPGRQPLGKLALLEGDPGLGKSLLTLDLGARLARGRGRASSSGRSCSRARAWPVTCGRRARRAPPNANHRFASQSHKAVHQPCNSRRTCWIDEASTLHVLSSFPPFFHQEEMSSISIRYSVFKRRIALATADSYCLE